MSSQLSWDGQCAPYDFKFTSVVTSAYICHAPRGFIIIQRYTLIKTIKVVHFGAFTLKLKKTYNSLMKNMPEFRKTSI